MNLLPLVMTFILIFSISSYTFFQRSIASKEAMEHFNGAREVHRKLSHKVHGKHFKKCQGKLILPGKRGTRRPSNRQTVFTSRRKGKGGSDEHKLSLARLLRGEDPKLEQIASALLSLLYQETSLYFPGFEQYILTTLKQHSPFETFELFLAKIPETDRPFFYKLVRGTQHYTPMESKGFPPLGDFFTVGRVKKKPINFNFAKEAVLLSLFDQNFTQTIIEKEEEKWLKKKKQTPLTKQELLALIHEHHPSLAPSLGEAAELLSFSSQKSQEEEIVLSNDKGNVQRRFSTK